jgi:sulfur carrier protein ThiS
MVVYWRAFGPLSLYLGYQTQQVELEEGSTLMDLVEKIGKRRSSILPSHYWDRVRRQFSPAVVAVVDGKTTKNFSRSLHSNQEIWFLDVNAGG